MGIIAANEPDSAVIDDIPTGLYYYYIAKNKINEAGYLGWVSTIESLTYNPFINEEDVDMTKAVFDSDRYGRPNDTMPNCYRIMNNNKIEKELGSIKLFPTKEELNQFDDIKLYLYPFRYFLITDYVNTPLIVKPQLVKTSNNKLTVKVITAPLSQEGKYNIYVDNYKFDRNGNLEGIINNSSLMLPVSSSAYSQFLATSSASFHQGNINAMLENDVTLKQGMKSNTLGQWNNGISSTMDVIGNVMTKNIGGALAGATSGVFNAIDLYNQRQFMQENHNLKENAISTMANAKVTDMLTTPKSIKTCGNDTIFNLVNSRNKIDIIEYKMEETQRDRILEYLQMYGYAINKYSRISINSRKYFTFVRTKICKVTGANIPHKDLKEIKEIFNGGITFWNMDNVTKIGDYQVNNEEV